MKKCLTILMILISFGTSFAQNYVNKGYEAYVKSDYDTAINYYNFAIESEPNNASIYNLRGNAYFSKHDYENAIIDYSKAITIQPNYHIYYTNRGQAYLNLRKYENAELDLTKAIQLKPDYYDAYISRGDLYRTRGGFLASLNSSFQDIVFIIFPSSGLKPDYSLAINDYTIAIQLNPQSELAYYNRGLSYKFINDYSNAVKDFSKVIEINPSEVKYYVYRGNTYKELRDYEKVLSDFSLAIKLEPKNYKHYEARGYIYLYKGENKLAINDFSLAINFLENYIKKTSLESKTVDDIILDSLDYDYAMLHLSSLFETRGTLYYHQGETENAIKDFIKMTEIEPNDLKGYINLGVTYKKVNNYSLSKTYFNKALTIDSLKSVQSAIALFYLNRPYEAEQLASNFFKELSEKIDKSMPVEKNKPLITNAYLNDLSASRKYFDISRVFALLNNKKIALECLATSSELGNSLSPVLLLNIDFENIKRTKEFRQILTSEGIIVPEYLPDTDVNIPSAINTNSNLYALIIGNEDYTSFQQGLSNEINVKYAENDAKIFKEYVIKSLGAPERNVTLLLNATGSRLMQEVEKISSFAEAHNGKAEIIFYYAGHGLASNDTKEPYLIPVDVDGSNLKYAVKLQLVLDKLSLYPTKRTTVFLDACFSGGARGQELISMRGVKVKPKESLIKGNLVVFASSSETQPSQGYDDMKHGLFTYFLLKKIKETQGNVNYKELFNYLKEQVSIESIYNKSQKQTPAIIISNDVLDSWSNWKLLE